LYGKLHIEENNLQLYRSNVQTDVPYLYDNLEMFREISTVFKGSLYTVCDSEITVG